MLFLNRRSQESVSIHNPYRGSAWNEILNSSEVAPVPSSNTSDSRLCGSPECTASRVSPWRNRKRPMFEDRWGCSGRCVLSMVRAAIRREIGDGLEKAASRHTHRLPLGLLMLAQGWINQSQLQAALALQKTQGGRIGDCLVEACGLEREMVAKGLGLQWSCPVLTTRSFLPSTMSQIAPHPLMEEFGFLPLRAAGNRLLYLGFEQSLDASVALALEHMTGLAVESGFVETGEYWTAHETLLQQAAVPIATETVSDLESLAGRITAILEQKQPVGSRLIRVHQYLWLRLWLESSSRTSRAATSHELEEMQDYLFTIKR